jgi:non-specific serine/threonine protein kinase
MAPAALRDSVGNLPAELTSFVGRRRELTEAKALLSSARLLTLTGMGGVGKTRLARRLVADVHRAFPDGVWQVELAELHEPALVAASVAAALGLPEPQGRWTIGRLQERLASRHMLVLLDNCEHLIDACAVTVDALLRACPMLHIVATSRQPLAIDGERTLSLSPLEAPDPAHADLGQLDQSDSARLFAERAVAALPGFAIDRHNQRAVAELCHLLDGLPLALEFAALRVRALSLDEIVARLDQESRLSASGSRIAPSRQQTLRALVDWSYQLCSPAERQLWCQLSVFAGGFDLDAAEGIAGAAVQDDDLVELIVGLVDKSVLVRETQERGTHYRMAEAIRDYGRERLTESGDESAARRRHRDWYVSLAGRAHKAFAGADQLTWFNRLRRQHPDVRAALEFSLSDADGAGPATYILVALLEYWLAFGFLSEGRYWLDQVLQKSPEPGMTRARALRASAYLAVFQGEQLSGALEEARVIARQAGDEHELAWCAFSRGAAALFAGDLDASAKELNEAVVGMRSAGDLHGLANVLAAHSVTAAMSGDVQAAEAKAAEFLEVADRVDERWLRAYVLWALGVAAWRAGQHRRAAELELESMALRLTFDDHLGLIWSAEVLAWIAAREGDRHTAAVLLGAATQAADAIGSSVTSFAFLADEHARCEDELRTALGGDVFEAAARRGAELTAEQVLDLARGAPTTVPTTVRAAPVIPGKPVDSPLTPREREIAELVAQGVSNKEIASRLVIAPRTAEGHVEHILVKLGFTSRAQIAAWVTGRRPS